MSRGSDSAAVVIRISPMAHFASGFGALALLTIVPALGAAGLALLVLPALLSVAIQRLRTVADSETVTARTLLGSRTVPWSQIEGLTFTGGRWARAQPGALLLPAVTFSTLPLLAAVSDGKVPNPYQRRRNQPGSGKEADAVQEQPGRDAAADPDQQGER